MYNFTGKTAFITGAATGIGRATALRFAQEGANVVVADIQDAAAQETVARITQSGGKALFIHCDVADAASVEQAVNQTVATFGGLHYAFNNAGIEGASGATAEHPLDNWERQIGINLSGVFYGMKYQIAQMLKQGSGAIVNCASILGTVAFAGAPAYVASKHGVIGLSKNAALEYGDKNIRVNVLAPAFIETPMLERGGITTDPQTKAYITSLHPIGRLGKPEEMAAAVVWLCSDEASFITGHTLLADGGYTAR